MFGPRLKITLKCLDVRCTFLFFYLRMIKERVIVKVDSENMIAVESLRGSLRKCR